ncbi:YxiJ family protein [Gottfriedia sp. OAE603]|uniref:YxiJ family protein n=1 Tax=Gottfriedia sp. OAE603 TaxID=2663872 RepID=UPI00367142D0
MKWLNVSFFKIFDQYKFIEANIQEYPTFYNEYLLHEKIRIYILHNLFLEKSYRT